GCLSFHWVIMPFSVDLLSPRGPRKEGQSSPAGRVPKSGGSRSSSAAAAGTAAAEQPTASGNRTAHRATRIDSPPGKGRLPMGVQRPTILNDLGLVTTGLGTMLRVNHRMQIPDDEL